jgi:hypothetical protein
LLFSPGAIGEVGEARAFGDRGSPGLDGIIGAAPGIGIEGTFLLFSEGASLTSGALRDTLLAPRDISSSDSSPGVGDLIARLGGGGGSGRAG